MTHQPNDQQIPIGALPRGPWLVITTRAGYALAGLGGAVMQALVGGQRVEFLELESGELKALERVTDGQPEGDGEASPFSVEERTSPAIMDFPGLCRNDRVSALANLIREGAYAAVFFPIPSDPASGDAPAGTLAWDALRASCFSATPVGYECEARTPLNLAIDISDCVEAKRRALKAVWGDAGSTRVERILALNVARAWSLPETVSHAEAFLLWPKEDRPLMDVQAALLLPRVTPVGLMGREPLVSVVIRTCNRPEALEVAVRSVAAQTWANIELVVVNDGGESVQHVLDACATGAIRATRYIPFDVNKGRSVAANTGLEAATGAFMMLLDDDDWLLPGHVAGLLEALDAQPEAIAANANVSAVSRSDERWVEIKLFNSVFDPVRICYENHLPIHSVLFRRRVVDSGVRFDASLELYEDWAFWLLVGKLGAIVHVDRTTACYRIHQGGGFGVHADPGQIQRSVLAFLRWSRQHWSDQQLLALHGRALGFDRIQAQLNDAQVRLDSLAGLPACLDGLQEELEKRQRALERTEQLLRDHVSQLTRVNADRDHLLQALAGMRSSRSWQVTAPLRWMGGKARVLRHLAKKGRAYVGARGVRQTVRSVVSVFRREGLAGLRARIRTHARPVAGADVLLRTPEAAVAWNPDDQAYSLAARAGGYVYIPSRPPENIAAVLGAMQRKPFFSIVVPVYNTPPALLREAVDSVLAQWYPDWELILADDASPSEETVQMLGSFSDARIRCLRLPENGGIAIATNAAIEAARGDFIVFLDHDDTLTEDCLFELACRIDADDPDFLYSDEDKLDPRGNFVEPHFKPDWSPDTMMSTMYTCHVSCMRTALVRELGGLRTECDGCQDWDLVLRLTERTNRIAHIPKVLYHWRIIPASTASDIAAKPYVLEASQKVRRDALARRGVPGDVEPVLEVKGYFRVRYDLVGTPLISIIIPTRDNHPVLKRCLESIRLQTRYENYEIVVIDNGSIQPETLDYLRAVESAEQKVRVLRHDAPFNFSELNNRGVGAARGELLLFLNDDTEVCQDDWLERLGGYAQQSHIGAVGAKLLYPGGKNIQHAGVLNLETGPVHAFLHRPANSPEYFMRNLLEYNWLAVTGACLMVRREAFESVGGFDESLPIAYNDVELCMRLAEHGFYNVVCQAVRLIHHESATRGLDHVDPVKRERLEGDKRRLYELHPAYFQNDPFFNPNLHPNGINFELADV